MQQTQSVGRVCPTPALVLALDALGLEVAADLESIFLHGDKRRAAVTRFLALTYNVQDGPGLIPVREAQRPQERTVLTRREAGQRIIEHAASLRAALETELRELHTQERLIEAGLVDAAAPPLDLFVVADLTEPSASGALGPLAYLIANLLAYEPEGRAHLLLSTATFATAGNGGTGDAQAYIALQELDALLDPVRTSVRRSLAAALGLEADAALAVATYLFDRHKEGTREVKDRKELRDILGNFLLALLSAGLAQQLGERLPIPEMIERRAFYSSGAASALVFEPRPLLETCAARLGADFIEMGQDAVPDARAVDEWAERTEDQIAGPRRWLEQLCANTPCEIRVGADGLHLGLHFHGFRFGGVQKEDWADKIASYSVLFDRTKLPRYTQTIQENADKLTGRTTADLEAAV